MSLIACPECQKEISSLAASCPSCGCPIQSKKDSDSAATPVITTQLTSKKYKGVILAGAVLWILGIALILNGLHELGSAAFLVGVILHLAGRMKAWWAHG